MAPIMSMLGSVASGLISQESKRSLANDQRKKADELLNKANGVVTKQAKNDPAYKLKAFLAQSGVPGYEQYLQQMDEQTQSNLVAAEKGASSGASLLNYVSALEGNENAQNRNLMAANDSSKATQKNNLASALYSMQTGFDAQAKKEKEMLSGAATQYEDAALSNKSAANEQVAATVGTAFGNAGEIMNSMGGSGNVSMGNMSNMFQSGKPDESMGSLGVDVNGAPVSERPATMNWESSNNPQDFMAVYAQMKKLGIIK